MHYHWNKTVEWEPLKEQEEEREDGTLVSTRELAELRVTKSIALTKSLVPDTYATWKAIFQSRPRIRFNGCYISTVNYVRTGQASTNQATWGGAPIHIVTYYRYLRFFRDGTVISLLTTFEPSHIVHHLTKELLNLHRDNAHAYLPSAAMQRAYKGRWRLSLDSEDTAKTGPAGEDEELQEGDLTVETEGVDPKYMFRMDLSLRTAGKAARNNKIVWRSFFSYNKLTDDWAEFTLKHDKAFFFSRVRSYGMGE
jgi:F-box protein 9